MGTGKGWSVVGVRVRVKVFFLEKLNFRRRRSNMCHTHVELELESPPSDGRPCQYLVDRSGIFLVFDDRGCACCARRGQGGRRGSRGAGLAEEAHTRVISPTPETPRYPRNASRSRRREKAGAAEEAVYWYNYRRKVCLNGPKGHDSL